MTNVAIEFAVFLPVMVFAAWPRIAGWLSARGLLRRIPTLPSLTFIEGGVEAAPPAATGAAPTAAPATAPAVSDEGDPPSLAGSSRRTPALRAERLRSPFLRLFRFFGYRPHKIG